MTELDRRLRRWRLELLRALCVEGSMHFAAALAAYLLIAFTLDALFLLPHGMRWVLFWMGACAAAVGVYLYFLKPLKRLGSMRLLRAVAARYPAMGAYLRPAWELSGWRADAGASEELALEHLARTDRLLKDLPQEAVFSCAPSWPSSRRLGTVAAVWFLGMPWLYRSPTQPQRILSPWRDRPLERLISVQPGSARLPWGQPVTLSARWIDERPNSGLILQIRPLNGAWAAAPWDTGGRTRVFHIKGLVAPLQYQIAYKGLRTPIYTLQPIPLPRLTQIRVRIREPGSAEGQTPQLPLEGGTEITALRASWVTLRGSSNQPMSSVRLEVSYLNAPVLMSSLGSGEWEGSFPLNESGTLKISAVGENGARDPDPLAYTLRALDDRPPVVELLSPTFELEISRKERLSITYSASDDYGLAAVSLVYQVRGQGPVEVPIKRFAPGTKESLADYAWDISGLPLGARMEFWLKAYDNARPKPQIGTSAKGVAHLVDFESAHQAVERKWLGMESSLKRLENSEAAAHRLMQTLARAASADRDRLAADAERMGRSLNDPWSETVSAMEDLARSMSEDPYANPGMTQMAQALAAALKDFSNTELSKAQSASRQGDYPEAARRHAALESRVRKSGEILARGGELQAMQDFLGEAYRMDQASSELQETLEKIARSDKAPGPEARRALEQALSHLRKEMDSLTQAIDALPKAGPESLSEKNRRIYSVPLNSAQNAAGALAEALERGDYAEAAKLARRLSEQLFRVRSGLGEAARSAVEEGLENAAAKVLQEASALWQEAIEGQSRGLQMTQKIELDNQVSLRLAQESLLKELAGEQAAALRDAAKLGSAVPLEAMQWLRETLKEFEAAQVRESPQLLTRAIPRLRARAASYSQEGGPAFALSHLADREQGIQERLAGGASPSSLSEAMLSERMAAEALQKQATKKTSQLRSRLEGVAQVAGTLPGKIMDSVAQAQNEQHRASEALGRRDSAGAQARQEKALDWLEEGFKSLNEALKRQESIGRGSIGGFRGPRGVARPLGGVRRPTGMDMGLVPLPKVEDYHPPQDIRREVEKSLREKRPSAFDGVIKDYFKRMSQ